VIFNGTSGGGGTGCTLTVTAPAGATVTVARDGKARTRQTGSDGIAAFKGLEGGIWTVTITDGSQTASKQVLLTTDYTAQMYFTAIPEFTYTGDYEIVDDADSPITESQGNWKIRFLTSGTLKVTFLNGAAKGIDVFLVGGGGGGSQTVYSNLGGGGGGGGGYTTTKARLSLTAGTAYQITVGAGGASNASGGKTEAFGQSAAGGSPGVLDSHGDGGPGGSGGGAGGYGSYYAGAGGTDGASGGSRKTGYIASGGKGQSTSTREFGTSTGKLYAGGGGGGAQLSAYVAQGGEGGGGNGGAGKGVKGLPGLANTGGGGGGAGTGGSSSTAAEGGSGGSGIVIIRNAR